MAVFSLIQLTSFRLGIPCLAVICAAVLAGPVAADGKTVRTVQSVAASGIDSKNGRMANPASAQSTATASASSVLQATASDQAGRAANSRPRNTNHSLNHQAKIQMYHKMTRLTQSAYARTMQLHAEYEALSNMSLAGQLATFPDGDHFDQLQSAAIRYNASVDIYYMAADQLAVAKAALTGGQELNGSVVEELNALLGQ